MNHLRITKDLPLYLGCKYSGRNRGQEMKNQEKVRKYCVCQKKAVTLRAFFYKNGKRKTENGKRKTENGKDKLMLWQV